MAGTILRHTIGSDIEKEGIVFRNTPLSTSFLFEIARCMKGVDEFEKVEQWNGQTIRVFDGEYFVLDLPNTEERDHREQLWRDIAKTKDQLDKRHQAPRVCGTFEFEGKSCIILSADVAMSGDTDGTLYNGLIFNPEAFLKRSENSTQLSDAIRQRKDDII